MVETNLLDRPREVGHKPLNNRVLPNSRSAHIPVGFCGALRGDISAVGGGIVFIPVIILLFHIPPVAALKIALSSQSFGMSSGAVGRIQKGVVPLSALKVTGPGLLIGSLLSSIVFHPSALLVKLFALRSPCRARSSRCCWKASIGADRPAPLIPSYHLKGLYLEAFRVVRCDCTCYNDACPGHASLPSDVEGLQRLVREQQAQLLSRDVLIEQLKLQLARLKKMKFGRSSEQLDAQIAQLELSFEELEVSVARAAPPKTLASDASTKPTRKPLPDHLPREPHVHEPTTGWSHRDR
jgi:hypothetical protein